MVRILIHGITTKTDALAAAKLGADGIGFILDESNDRYIEFTLARDIIRNLPPIMSAFLQPAEYDMDLLENIIRKLRIGTLIIPVTEYNPRLETLGCRLTLTGTAEEIFRHAASSTSKQQYLPTDLELGELHDEPESEIQKWRDLNESHHLLMPCEVEPPALQPVLRSLKPAALFFQGGTESHTGLQDYPRIQAYIQEIHSIVERV